LKHSRNASPVITILGIDPGSRITGVGVIKAQGSTLKHVYSESLKLPKGELPLRLQAIYTQIQAIIAQTRPDVVSIEKVFIAKNPQSALVSLAAAVCHAHHQQINTTVREA